jgi:hypothetical protein
MNDLNLRLTDHSRLAATLLLVGTLVLGLAAGADWLRDYLSSADACGADAGFIMAQETRESGSGDGEGMMPNGRTKAEPSGCCLVPVILKSDNSNNRLRSAGKTVAETSAVPQLRLDRRPTMTSSSRIHSGLGRQFTLVGARPSGTS